MLKLAKPSILVPLALLLVISRASDFFFYPAFWAEEGSIFYKQQAELGWKALTTTYAGYLHLYPRLVALLCSNFSIENTPFFFHLGALGAHALLLYAVFRFMENTPHLRALAVLATVLIPHNGEAFLNTPNTISVLAPIIPLLFLSRPTSFGKNIFEIILVSVAMLSGPYGLLSFLFLFISGLIQGFDRRKYTILGICAALGLVQISFMNLQVRAPVEAPFSLLGFLNASSTFIYYLFFGFLGIVHETWLKWLIIFAVFGLSWRVIKKIRCTKNDVLMGGTLILIGGAIWGAALIRGLGNYMYYTPTGAGGRYFWPPYVLFCIGLIYLLRGSQNQKAVKLFSLLILLSTLPRFVTTLPSRLDGWREEVINAPPGPILVRALPDGYWTFKALKK